MQPPHVPDPTTSAPAGANPSYVLGQLARALTASESHPDAEVRERAARKVEAWTRVIEGMLAGSIQVGSRVPVLGAPAWATGRCDWPPTAMAPNRNGWAWVSDVAIRVTPMYSPRINVYNKGGSLSSPDQSRHVRADAARLRFPDGQEVLMAVFMDYISDNPDDLDESSDAAMNQAEQAIRNVAKAVAEHYHQ